MAIKHSTWKSPNSKGGFVGKNHRTASAGFSHGADDERVTAGCRGGVFDEGNVAAEDFQRSRWPLPMAWLGSLRLWFGDIAGEWKFIWLVVWNLFFSPHIGNNDPNWLIFFRGVEIQTTNQLWKSWICHRIPKPLKSQTPWKRRIFSPKKIDNMLWASWMGYTIKCCSWEDKVGDKLYFFDPSVIKHGSLGNHPNNFTAGKSWNYMKDVPQHAMFHYWGVLAGSSHLVSGLKP